MLPACQETLKNLQLDYLDLYLVKSLILFPWAWLPRYAKHGFFYTQLKTALQVSIRSHRRASEVGSHVIKASAIQCWSIPSIDSLNGQGINHSIDISVNSQSKVNLFFIVSEESVNTRMTINRLLTKCQLSVV